MTVERNADVAIIGAGTAGMHAYEAARERGLSAIIIERGPGGTTCTRDGCIPSKLLIAAGRAADAVRAVGTFGVEVGKPRVDGIAVMRRVRDERDRMDGSIRRKLLDIPDDHRIHGTARFVEPNVIEAAGIRITAGRIVLAAGAKPAMPPALRSLGDLVHTHETIFELGNLPVRLAVIGGGAIGIELSQAFSRLGVDVTLMDAADRIGGVTDPEAERALRDALSRDFSILHGVDVEAERHGGAARLSWTGSTSGSVTVDCVLAAAGRQPDLADLDLEAAGLRLDGDGVPEFDPATRRCGSSGVYVAGDVDDWRPVLHEAARGARVAIAHAFEGRDCPQIPDLAIAFTEPGLAEVGCRFDALPTGAVVGTAEMSENARATIDAKEAGVVRLYADADGRLLGATIVGAAAEHMGQTIALALSSGMTAATFLDQAWYHPVYEEALQSAARDLIGRLGN